MLRFIEDNWLAGKRTGPGSFDATAGSIMGLFDFSTLGGNNAKLFLDPTTGTPVASAPSIERDERSLCGGMKFFYRLAVDLGICR